MLTTLVVVATPGTGVLHTLAAGLSRGSSASGVFMLVTLAVFALYGPCAAAVRDRVISRPRVMTWMRRVFAGSFGALAGRLALADR